jgi:hypothetical protein
MIARLRHLRDRDPSFLADLQISPDFLPPPTPSSGSLLPHAVVFGYLFGDL